MLGQTVMADGIGEPRPEAVGFDNGIDFIIFGHTVDLKTMGRTTNVGRGYVNNLVASQLGYATEVYVFSSINKKTSVMTFCGVLHKAGFGNFFIPKGTARTRYDGTKFITKVDMYEIPNSELSNKFTDWTTLCWAVDQVI